jgi:hypothetical protein
VTAVDDLGAWLLAQIKADAEVARAAAEAQSGRDEPGDRWRAGDDVYTAITAAPVAVGPWGGGLHETGEHIARWDPACVLAECETKKQTMELHSPQQDTERSLACQTCGVPDGWWDVAWPCDTLRLLAALYADRPGYRPEWAPA